MVGARSGAVVAAPADPEEAQLVFGDAEAMRLSDATSQARQDVRLEEASVEILDVAAPPADQVVVRRERLGQLVAALALGGVRRTHQPDVAEKLHGAIDGDEVDALSAEGTVKLGTTVRGSWVVARASSTARRGAVMR